MTNEQLKEKLETLADLTEAMSAHFRCLASNVEHGRDAVVRERLPELAEGISAAIFTLLYSVQSLLPQQSESESDDDRCAN